MRTAMEIDMALWWMVVSVGVTSGSMTAKKTFLANVVWPNLPAVKLKALASRRDKSASDPMKDSQGGKKTFDRQIFSAFATSSHRVTAHTNRRSAHTQRSATAERELKIEHRKESPFA